MWNAREITAVSAAIFFCVGTASAASFLDDLKELGSSFGEYLSEQSTSAVTASKEGMATRIFAGPEEYPPAEFAAYGIAAFRSLPSPDDLERYRNICLAYYNTLPPPPPDTPQDQQMVTVWPVTTADVSKSLNAMQSADEVCREALSNYNLRLGHQAIQAAKIQGKDVDGIGPYLLAWSPSDKFGSDNAIVLVADFSNVRSYSQAQRVMVAWVNDIESDPRFWEDAFTLDRVRAKIKMLVDRYGAELEGVFKAKS